MILKKIEVNAAIERLIHGKEFDIEAAHTVIDFGLNASSRITAACASNAFSA